MKYRRTTISFLPIQSFISAPMWPLRPNILLRNRSVDFRYRRSPQTDTIVCFLYREYSVITHIRIMIHSLEKILDTYQYHYPIQNEKQRQTIYVVRNELLGSNKIYLSKNEIEKSDTSQTNTVPPAAAAAVPHHAFICTYSYVCITQTKKFQVIILNFIPY